MQISRILRPIFCKYPMLNIHLITIGKLKESYWREAEAEYLKRLKPYAKIRLTELTEEPFRDGSDRDKIKAKEADKIKKHLSDRAIIIAMHEQGKQFSSTELAEFLNNKSTHGDELTFVIGGSLGLHESILELAQYQLSLSPLTFPHQLARVILCEQLYRSATILQKKTYHY